VAARIKEARERRGWSQQKLADRLGIARPTVTKIEQGGERASNLSVFNLFAFAVALGVAPVHLLVPLEDDDAVQIAPDVDPLPAPIARAWIRGAYMLRDSDAQAWIDNLPLEERKAFVAEALRRHGVEVNTDELSAGEKRPPQPGDILLTREGVVHFEEQTDD
jgi:transcriptional regulator with XRE-family HTH domain